MSWIAENPVSRDFVYPVYVGVMLKKLGLSTHQINKRRPRWIDAGLCRKDSGGVYIYDLRGIQRWEWQNRGALETQVGGAASDTEAKASKSTKRSRSPTPMVV